MLLAALLVAGTGCGSSSDPVAPRTYRLGFTHLAPRLEIPLILETIDLWTRRGDAALLAITPPWRALLADTSASLLVRRDFVDLVGLYRARGLKIVAMIDATDGLAREREHPDLIADGRSIAEPAVQAVYREYALAVDSILRPDHLAIAMETNLIRAIAPASLYASVVAMTNATAAALEAAGTTSKLAVSVQVETAWGRLPATGAWVGIAQDLADFPFLEWLGLSSYPFLGGFAEPEDVPLDYYARLRPAPERPMMVIEGGWSSASVGSVTSTPDKQARWIKRQMRIADHAELAGVFQITFTDLDLTSFPVPPGSILPLFAHLGLVDTGLRPKPALAEWDRAFARPLWRP